ncbi:MAG: hypothetical protein KIT22_20035, partial [Verrucomicrobiae bacterium]|nr:hypothetical protein [Verrucomicrobiae bacterium]
LRERDPLPPRLLNPSVPADLETICLKCLEKEPARRYPTALELAEELRRWQAGEPIRARPISRPERAWRWCRRRPALASALLAAAALFAVVSVGVPTAAFRVNRARQDAQAALQRHRVQLAEEMFHRGDTRQALGNLVRVLREDPHDNLAANRLMSALTYRRFPLPVTPPLTHAAAIKDARFSPDGAVVVTASADGTAQLWNAQSGERLGQPMAHPMGEPTRSGNTVGSVDFSPDGRRVATGSANGAARVWDAATGAPLTDWLRPADPQATADPKSAAGGWRPGQVPTRHVFMKLPDTVGGGVRTLTEPRGVTRVRFTPDGTRLVTASDDALVRIWDVATGRCVLTLPHDGLVWDAQFNFDGTLLVTSCWDFNAYVWDLRSERLLSRLAHGNRVLSAEFSPDGRWLLTSSRSEARLWRREGT